MICDRAFAHEKTEMFDRPDAELHQVGVYHDKFRRVGEQLKLAERRCVYDSLLIDNALCLPV